MSSDFVSILVAARWGSVGLMVIVLVMMTYILCLRAVLLMRERRYAKLSARWTPILLEGGARNPKPLPAVPLAQRVPQYQQQQPFAGRNGRQGLGIPRTALEQYRSPPRGQLGVASLPHEQYRTQTQDIGHHHQHDDHQADRPPTGGNQY